MRDLTVKLLCSAAALVIVPQVAFAQQQTSTTQAATSTTEPAEIIVTAQHREERLLDVPIAISTVTGAQLKETGSTDIADLARVTSGINIPEIGGMIMPTVRGIGTRSVSTGDEQVVPVYIDGVYQAVLLGSSYDLGDVSRVEVLKGPQSVLFGRNATGGAISITTLTPKPGFTGNLELEGGNLGDRAASGYFGGGTDMIRGSLTFAVRDIGDWIYDVARQTKTGGSEENTVRGKIVILPTSHDEIDLSSSYSDGYDRGAIDYQVLNGNSSVRVTTPSVLLPVGRGLVADSQENQNPHQLNTYNLGYTHNFRGFDFVNVSSYQRTWSLSDFDGDNTFVPAMRLYIHTNGEAIYQEDYVRSTYQGAFQWIAGGVYYKSTVHLNPQITYIGGNPLVRINAKTGTESYAGYAEGTYSFTDQWKLSAGFRTTSEQRTLEGTITGVTRTPAEATFSKTTPTVMLQYEPTTSLNIYARYGQAFKAGLYNVSSTSNALVQPENVTQYELGVKTHFGPFQYLNADIYYTDYSNLQVSSVDPITRVSVLGNAATSRIKGAEFDTGIRLARGLMLKVSGTYVDSEYVSYKNAALYIPNPAAVGGNIAVSEDVSGKPLVLDPKWSGNIGLDYKVDLGPGELLFNTTAQYTGKFDRTADGRITQPAYTLLDAQVSFRPRNSIFQFTLYGRNLTDVTYDNTVTSTPGGDFHSYALPRTYGVRVSAAF